MELAKLGESGLPYAHERHSIDWKRSDYVKPVLQERAERLAWLQADEVRLAAVMAFYKTNPARFIDDWMMTYDPRRSPAFWPFVLFPRQIEFIEWIQERYETSQDPHAIGDGVADKSRDVGFSWLFCAWSIWAWTFIPGMKIGMGSYREAKVDRKDDPDSLFEKLRMVIKLTPNLFLPPGWNERAHAPFMKIINPWNGNTITGEAGDQVGRGGRSTVYFIDEAAFLEHPDLADRGLSMNSNCKLYASTANGMGNRFAQKRFAGVLPVFSFHWKQDPRKDQKWYDAQKLKMDPIDLAVEVDIDYSASIENLFIEARWVESAKDIANVVDFPEYHGGVSGLDVGGSGTGKSVHTTRFGPIVLMPTSWGDPDTIKTAYKAADLTKTMGAQYLNFDSVGIGDSVTWALRHIEAGDPDDPVAKAYARGDHRRVVPSETIVQDIQQARVEGDVLLSAMADAGITVQTDTEAAVARGMGEAFQNRGTETNVDELTAGLDQIIPSNPINVGLPAPDDVVWGDGRTSLEKFANLKAHLWFTMRERFRNTHEHYLWVTGEEGGRQHPLEDLISLPDCPELCSQLSLPRMERKGNGKIGCESKRSLQKRGIKSPDFAESLSLTYAPEELGMDESEIQGMY